MTLTELAADCRRLESERQEEYLKAQLLLRERPTPTVLRAVHKQLTAFREAAELRRIVEAQVDLERMERLEEVTP